jgi:hypothetical protein
MVKLFLEGVWGSGCIRVGPHFLDLGTSWSWSPSRTDRFIPGENPSVPIG